MRSNKRSTKRNPFITIMRKFFKPSKVKPKKGRGSYTRKVKHNG